MQNYLRPAQRLEQIYNPRFFLKRFVTNSLFGILILLFFTWLKFGFINFSAIKASDLALVSIGLNLQSEALLLLDKLLERVLPVPERLKRRIFVQLFSSAAITMIMYVCIRYFWSLISDRDSTEFFFLGAAIGLALVTFSSTGLILIRLVSEWMLAQQQIEEMKREKIQMDYNQLQDQLNPHFLFNNLSVLKSLITYNTQAALSFTDNFTDVYRYVLDAKKNNITSLDSELAFIESYIALHKERLGDGLVISFESDGDTSSYVIAPMSLQILIENSIKHNVASKSQPLQITVIKESDYITVENPIQKKISSYSTNTGLSNLVQRYQFLTDKPVLIKNDTKFFKVSVPLLKSSR